MAKEVKKAIKKANKGLLAKKKMGPRPPAASDVSKEMPTEEQRFGNRATKVASMLRGKRYP